MSTPWARTPRRETPRVDTTSTTATTTKNLRLTTYERSFYLPAACSILRPKTLLHRLRIQSSSHCFACSIAKVASQFARFAFQTPFVPSCDCALVQSTNTTETLTRGLSVSDKPCHLTRGFFPLSFPSGRLRSWWASAMASKRTFVSLRVRFAGTPEFMYI